MCVYLCTKFQVFRVILTSFRQRVILLPTSKWTPKKTIQIRVKVRIKILKNASCITMTKTICWIQHTEKNRSRKKLRQRWKSIVLMDGQCCKRQNNEKLEKKNQCKTREQQKRLFKTDIKTKLHVSKYIWQ